MSELDPTVLLQPAATRVRDPVSGRKVLMFNGDVEIGICKPVEDLVQAVNHEKSDIRGFDTSCFSGEYVTGDVSRAYLDALERHDCVGGRSGWVPAHLRLVDGTHAPCYRKSHSWGEFVFDFALAQAYAQDGLRYYPKLVCCVPYTPVPGRRLIAADDAGLPRLSSG